MGAKQTSCYAATIEKIAVKKEELQPVTQLLSDIEKDCNTIIKQLQILLQ